MTPGPDRPIWDRDGVTTIPERMKSRLDARQLVVVTGSRLGIRAGRVRVFEYRSGDWVRTMDVSARWGENGLVNGLLRHAGTRTTPTGIWLMPGWAFGTHPRKPSGVELGWRHITQNSWWSSENNATYNTWVETSRYVYGEHLADYPVAYEYGINSGYNARPNPCVYGRGSGIFLHVRAPRLQRRLCDDQTREHDPPAAPARPRPRPRLRDRHDAERHEDVDLRLLSVVDARRRAVGCLMRYRVKRRPQANSLR